jgi:hypothetical protein
LPLLLNIALKYGIRKVQENQGRTGIDWNTSALVYNGGNKLIENKYPK